jgi:hypothetical protein
MAGAAHSTEATIYLLVGKQWRVESTLLLVSKSAALIRSRTRLLNETLSKLEDDAVPRAPAPLCQVQFQASGDDEAASVQASVLGYLRASACRGSTQTATRAT